MAKRSLSFGDPFFILHPPFCILWDYESNNQRLRMTLFFSRAGMYNGDRKSGNHEEASEIMAAAVIVLFALDALLAAAGYWLGRRWEEMSFVTVLGACVLALFIHCGAPVLMAGPRGGAALVPASILFGATPAYLFGRVFLETLTHSAVHGAFFSSPGKPIPTDFSKARSLTKQNDIEGALKQYRAYFNEDPESPQPLFEMAGLLLKEQRTEEAERALQEIVHRFREKDGVWAKATFRLAMLHRDHRQDQQMVVYLLREIVRRAPKSEPADSAREWLAEIDKAGPE